jgi:polyphosphate kinase
MTSKQKAHHGRHEPEKIQEQVSDESAEPSPPTLVLEETALAPTDPFAPDGNGRLPSQLAQRSEPSELSALSEPSPVAPTGREHPPLLPELYINRELSWLEFNCRVLEAAESSETPLLERIKFAAIFSNNLDEFFMIRVAGIKRKVVAGITDPGPDGRAPSEAFAEVRSVTQSLLERHARLLKYELLPNLSAEGVAVVGVDELNPVEQKAVAGVFEREVFPVLTPQAVDRARRFPHVSNQSLNLIVALRSTAAGSRFARIKIPAVLPRLLVVPGSETRDKQGKPRLRMVLLEQLIAHQLPRLFPGNEIVASYPFHVIRDSDIDVDEDEDEAHDLLNTMREFLSQRTFGSVIMVITDTSMPDEVRSWLLDQLHAGSQESYVVDGPLACESLLTVPKVDRPDLYYPQFTPSNVPALEVEDELTGEMVAIAPRDIFAMLRERDVLVHHPYQTFNAVADFLRAAATDPDVVAIKQTLYRIGRDSPLIPALIEARDDDTQVAVLVELKARFDEENNITWAQQLEQHGVHVAYGVAGLKTHCKATLVVRRERDGLRRYVHIATGNYNATTARMYEDLGLLTAREDIGSDISELFNVLTGYSQQDHYRKLWVAPIHLRRRFLEAIDREIDAHKKTGEGHLIFKMNSLVDREIIRALYGASQAGVKIDLIIRGICCLRPGVPGWSETIRVRSIVGRFLEHSRIYYFRNGGNEQFYLGSADLMERNLDRRVEAIVPVEDPALCRHLRDRVLAAYMRDTVNARELQSDGSYVRIKPKRRKERVDVHRKFIDLYARKRI